MKYLKELKEFKLRIDKVLLLQDLRDMALEINDIGYFLYPIGWPIINSGKKYVYEEVEEFVLRSSEYLKDLGFIVEITEKLDKDRIDITFRVRKN